jgi:hypothetical protein
MLLDLSGLIMNNALNWMGDGVNVLLGGELYSL